VLTTFFMQLTAEAQAHLESFFRAHLHDEQLALPAVSIHTGRFARVLTRTFSIGALTFGRHVFVAPTWLVGDVAAHRLLPGWLLAHEVMHVLQYERTGMTRFLWAYLREYARALRREPSMNGAAHWSAYRAITHEAEAYAVEAAYRAWQDGAEALQLN
jgi:Domain of unknown function (DUF4157)